MNRLPKWLTEIVDVMERIDRGVHKIEKRLNHSLKVEETDSNLASEIKSARNALESVKSSLTTLDEATQRLVKDVVFSMRPHRTSRRKSGRERNRQTTRDRRIEVAAAVLRHSYPLWSEARIRNKAVQLATRIYLKTTSRLIDDPLISDVETGVHERGGFQFRHEPKLQPKEEKEEKYIPFTYGYDGKTRR